MQNVKKAILGGAMVAVIGAGLIGGNAVLAANALGSEVQTSVPQAVNISYTAPSTNHEKGYQVLVNESGSMDIAYSATDLESVKAAQEAERQNGADPRAAYVEAQPEDGDISEQQAEEIARDALMEKYALKADLFARFTVTHNYFTTFEDIKGVPLRRVYYYPTDLDVFSDIGCYTALIDAKTGEVVRLLSAADGKG